MRYRWRIVALLFFLSVVNYLDRQTLSVMAPTLRSALGFSAVEYSYVVTAFLVAYTLGYLFCGTIIDRLGVRIAVVLALAVWSVAGMCHAFVTTWVGLAVCRFVLGLGESFNAPCGVKAISEWVPRRVRGLCTEIFSNGFVDGAILAPPLVSFIALRYGWQWAFLATGLTGFVYLLFWWKIYRSPEHHPKVTEHEREYILRDRPSADPKQNTISVWRALANPLCIGFILSRFLTDSLSYFFSFWLPEYLQNGRGFSLAMVGALAWIPFLAADIGGPGGGAMSDWLVRRGWPAVVARRRLLLVAACLMPAALGAVFVPSSALALALIAVVLAAQSCWNSNLMTLMAEIFPRQHMGTYVAVAGVGGSLGGITSTLMAGKVIEKIGYVPVFSTLGFLHLAAFAIIYFFMRCHCTRVNSSLS
jgi:ACS family hexuronate transporter-like MFS transporter